MKGLDEVLVVLVFFGGIFFLIWFFGKVSRGDYNRQIDDFFAEYEKQRRQKTEERIRKMAEEMAARSKT